MLHAACVHPSGKLPLPVNSHKPCQLLHGAAAPLRCRQQPSCCEQHHSKIKTPHTAQLRPPAPLRQLPRPANQALGNSGLGQRISKKNGPSHVGGQISHHYHHTTKALAQCVPPTSVHANSCIRIDMKLDRLIPTPHADLCIISMCRSARQKQAHLQTKACNPQPSQPPCRQAARMTKHVAAQLYKREWLERHRTPQPYRARPAPTAYLAASRGPRST